MAADDATPQPLFFDLKFRIGEERIQLKRCVECDEIGSIAPAFVETALTFEPMHVFDVCVNCRQVYAIV